MALVKLPMFSVDRIWLSSLGCLTVEYLCCFEVAKESCRNDVRYISVIFETGSHVALVGLLVCTLVSAGFSLPYVTKYSVTVHAGFSLFFSCSFQDRVSLCNIDCLVWVT